MKLSVPFLAAVAFFSVSRFAIVLWLPPFFSDVQVYYRFAVLGVDLGKTPYRDFKIEYPPVSYWMTVAPRLVDPAPVPKASPRGIPYPVTYRRLFMAMACILDAAAFLFLCLTLARRRPALLTLAAWGYAAIGVLLAPVLYDRLDSGLLFLLLLWSLAVALYLESPVPHTGFLLLACLVLGLSAAHKWLPILALPLFWFGCRRLPWTTQVAAFVALAAAALLPFAVHWLSAGNDIFWFVRFHGERLLEVESIYATFLLATLPLGQEVLAFQGPGSWDIAGPASAALAQGSTFVMLTVPVALALWAWRRRQDYDLRAAYRFCLFLLIACVLAAKVLSTQYFVWLLPMLLLLGAEILDQRRFIALIMACLALAGLTTWIFPFHFMQVPHPRTGAPLNETALLQGLGEFRSFHETTVWILILRNTLLIALMLWLTVVFCRRSFQSPPDAMSDAPPDFAPQPLSSGA